MSTKAYHNETKLSPAIKTATLADKASQLRNIAGAARDTTTFAPPPLVIKETVPVLAVPPALVQMSEATPPASVALFEKQLRAEKRARAIAGFYATHLRIDMKTFKRAEKLLLDFKANITDQESLKLNLGLLAKHLNKATASKAEVKLLYSAGRISFVRNVPKHGTFTQSLVFEGKDVSIYTKWEGKKQVELLRATRYAADTVKSNLDFDAGIWRSYLADGYKLSELNKTLDVAERQRLKLKELVAKVSHKPLIKFFTPSLINKAQIKTDKRTAGFIDILGAKGQRLSLKVTRLVSSALLNG